MSSKRFAAPLRLDLQASRQFVLYLSAAYSAGIAAIWLTPLTLSLQALASIILLLCLLHGINKHALRRHPRSVIKLLWDAHGEWLVDYRDGATTAVQLRDGCFCHPLLVVMNFSRPGFPAWFSVAIFPDALPADVFRRLRVRLKLEAGSARAERYI